MTIHDFAIDYYRLEGEDVEIGIRHRYTLERDGTRAAKIDAEDAQMLAILLIKEKVFLNSHWWEKEWPEAARKTASLNVSCNDVFAWGCADAETIGHADIEDVFSYFEKDSAWGTDVWCIVKRQEMPQRPVEKSIRAGGIWDLDALKAQHGLRANCYDGRSRVLADMKYTAYCEWECAEGREPMPFDAKWWDGWKRFTDATPDWRTADWQTKEDQRLRAWSAENGYAEQITTQSGTQDGGGTNRRIADG